MSGVDQVSDKTAEKKFKQLSDRMIIRAVNEGYRAIVNEKFGAAFAERTIASIITVEKVGKTGLSFKQVRE